uniref:beta-galactosidase n=1 Tax=Aegilops tauschii subsp. strangulata TaxID=200361 RepID=A0A453IH45_AEGTS
QKAKDGGLDMVETYVFWDVHEPVRGQARSPLHTGQAKAINLALSCCCAIFSSVILVSFRFCFSHSSLPAGRHV